jgi:Uma2 family endonuclease
MKMINENTLSMLVSQDKIHVEQFTRRVEGGWLLTETNRREDTSSLTSVGCELSLTEIYDGVDDLPPMAG